MALNAHMLVRLFSDISDSEIQSVRNELYESFGGSCFVAECEEAEPSGFAPFTRIDNIAGVSDVLPECGHWFDMNLALRYFGPGYPKGNLDLILRIADWVLCRLTDAEVWYGNDSDEVTIKKLTDAYRHELVLLNRTNPPQQG